MKRPSNFWRLGALALVALAGTGARADDIDIYQGTTSGAAPNLLMILDNSAAADASSTFTCPGLTVNNPTKNLGFEQCGLYSAVKSVGTDAALNGNINLGLMYFPSGGTNGGTFVLPAASPAPSSLLLMDGNGSDGKGVSQMLTRVAALSLASDKSNNNQIPQTMQEAWAFYQGKTGLSGTTYPGLSNPLACARNFVLYITLATRNQKPQDSGKLGGSALQSAEALTTLPAQLTLPSWKSPISPYATAAGKYQSDYSDEWANFMYTGASPNLTTPYPAITTYTIILSDGTNPDYEQLMVSMANQGGGKYFVVQIGDVSALANAIGQVFSEVQAVNSVFAAPVLPVSANTQGTYVNQIYMGMFRPDGSDNPRWMGNLKQYQFGVDTTDPTAPQLFLADASWGTYSAGTNANRALSAAGTGFISPTAVSFWSGKDIDSLPDSKGGFWLNAFRAQGAKDGYDWADGQIVEKGGVGQQIRLKYLTDSYPPTSTASATTSRNVYTCVGTGCIANAALSAMPFKAGNTNLTSTALGITSSSVTAVNLINWARGDDTFASGDSAAGLEASSPPDARITVRGSVHGDVLHSRPVVIDYGGTTGVVVFYGANDGLFRAVNGNQPNNPADSSKPKGNCTLSSTCAITVKDATGATASVPPGGELWSFVPPEFYPGLQRLYQNSPALKLGSSTTGAAKTYFFDGAPGVYQNSATGKAYIFLSARRGGRLLYALDVSDPVNPKFMWKRSNADTGFGELGQTWSQPKVAMIKGNANPVLIFGAGYDTNEDAEPPAADTMGRGIFILDAITGNLLWQAGPGGGGTTCTGNPCKLAGMNYAIPADITLVDRDFDGYIDRLYAADTGGNIWRVDLQPTGSGDASTWQATQLAALGGTGTTKRKFFFSPDVVLTKTYDVVLDITGDREHPLLTQKASGIVNRFYMVKDTNVGGNGAGWTPVHDDTSSAADAAPAALFHATAFTPYDGTLSGFYVTLSGAGEKGVNAPTTVGGTVYFGTNQPIVPSSTSCQANLGSARSYGVNFLTGSATSRLLDGGGLAPSPVFGVVTVNVDGKDRRLPFLIGGGGGSGPDGKSGLGAQKPIIPLKATRKRTYWYRETDH
jgi:type IV pilus assembly protein PilY1